MRYSIFAFGAFCERAAESAPSIEPNAAVLDGRPATVTQGGEGVMSAGELTLRHEGFAGHFEQYCCQRSVAQSLGVLSCQMMILSLAACASGASGTSNRYSCMRKVARR